jgi:hypothetical protein
LDDQLEKVDFDDITVSELKEMLRQRGKPATGKKAILVQRLQDERKRPMSIQLPTSPYLPGSPSPSLHRSIANMHIGSPPARRYSPYSPRSPKTALSSSVPAEDAPLVSPIQHLPNTGSYQMNRARYYNYKPFTSSALATPDREEVNPFDRYYETKEDVPNDMNIDWLDPSLDILLQQGM